MTKKAASSVANQLAVRCDDAYLFAVKCGASGCVSNIKATGDWRILLTLLLALIDRVLDRLKANHYDAARELLCLALVQYLADIDEITVEKPVEKPAAKLSDKQRARRARNNDRIIDAIEEALK